MENRYAYSFDENTHILTVNSFYRKYPITKNNCLLWVNGRKININNILNINNNKLKILNMSSYENILLLSHIDNLELKNINNSLYDNSIENMTDSEFNKYVNNSEIIYNAEESYNKITLDKSTIVNNTIEELGFNIHDIDTSVYNDIFGDWI